jgi:hypothetical protein
VEVIMPRSVRLVFALAILAGAPAFAQSSEPLEPQRGMVWGAIGMQGDVGGSVNSSGIGLIGTTRAEVDRNTWGERYDAALVFRIGGAYNLTSHSQLFAAFSWQQAEADAAVVGLIGGAPLDGEFSDYQGWGIDAGYRYVFDTTLPFAPFVAGSVGLDRLQAISLTLSSTVYTATDIPFYDESWVPGWRVGTGFLWNIDDRFGAHVSLDLKYSGVLSDQSGIGTAGFERINNAGNRWTLPLMTGVYVKF